MSRSSLLPIRSHILRAALAIAAIVALVALWVPRSATAAIELAEQDKVLAGVPAAGMYFGSNVALDGDVLVSAAPNSGFGSPPSAEGVAYVHRYSGGSWSQEQVLTAGDDGSTSQSFAGSWANTVAVSGDTILVGAPNDAVDGTSAGAAYVFTYDGSAWSSTPQELRPSDAAAYAYFGRSVSFSPDGSTLLVGADHFGGTIAGKVYVYEHDGTEYVHEQTLTPSDGAGADQFGVRAYMSPDTIVVSSWLDDNANGANAGALYVFDRDESTGAWPANETSKLVGGDGQAGWQLGWALAVSPDGNTIAASTAAGLDGGVYVFERAGEGWADRGALPHPVDAVDWLMGDSMAMSNDTLVIGHSAMSQEIGGAQVYRRAGATWAYSHRLLPSDGGSGDFEASPSNPDDWGDWAGTSVAMSGSRVAIGAPNHDVGAVNQAGAVYVFEDAAFDQPSTDRSEQREIMPSDAEIAGSFGSNVALDDDVMVVGAPEAGIGSTSAGTGAAIVYRRVNGSWSEEAALTAEGDAFVGQGFASSWAKTVAVAGDTIVVGASQDNGSGTDRGAAYVFSYDGSAWSRTQKLTPADLIDYDRFGMHVSISADESTILVGAPFSGLADEGQLYVYEHDGTGYALQDTLAHPEAGSGDQFGIQADVGQDTIVVSAWLNDNANGANAGALYVFQKNGTTGDWDYDEKLLISGGQAGWQLGWGLSISPDGNTVATSTAAGLEGGVYLFERDGASWTDLGALAHPADTGDWLMGDSIDLSNDTLVIGHSAMNEEIGGAHLYRHDGSSWSHAHRLVPSDGAPGNYEAAPGTPDAWGDWAGTSVSLSGANVAIGAPNHDDGGAQAGSVYVFRDPGPAPDQDTDGLSNDLESDFGGGDDSLAIENPETGDAAYAEGTVAEGVTLYSGSYAIDFPPNSSVVSGSSQIAITMVPGDEPRVAVSGADLSGGTKSITIPFDATAANPAVCILDAPDATVDAVLDASGCGGTAVGIPATVGASTTVGAYVVTRLVDARARVEGLSHTALASFDLGNAAPSVDSVSASVAPVPVDSTVNADASFSDPDDGNAHAAVWSWGDGTTSTGSVDQSANTATGSHVYDEAGVYRVSLTITDTGGSGASAEAVFEYVVVYDPDGGYATGGGRIDSPEGACTWSGCDETTVGEASFGFVSKYLPGGGPGSTPSGNTTFHFKAGDLKFKSLIQGWLVIAGQNKAKYMGGTGQINNQGDYSYMVTVVDNGSSGDTFRIKIWDNQSGGGVVYDNKMGVGDESYDGTEISAGNIKVHKD